MLCDQIRRYRYTAYLASYGSRLGICACALHDLSHHVRDYMHMRARACSALWLQSRHWTRRPIMAIRCSFRLILQRKWPSLALKTTAYKVKYAMTSPFTAPPPTSHTHLSLRVRHSACIWRRYKWIQGGHKVIRFIHHTNPVNIRPVWQR